MEGKVKEKKAQFYTKNYTTLRHCLMIPETIAKRDVDGYRNIGCISDEDCSPVSYCKTDTEGINVSKFTSLVREVIIINENRVILS